ncbi:MFS transporter [Salinibacterium sp. SWN248]|uniref:MFS transporter n=1 Tax=Salinibacterium sp. SWN248 TaxID=2792056 RepID=UPI0018CF2D28|nr:MFS transporter [Salinibacterium sp. SWN248]MBH0024831.1 MFS transporter [Salinibacterium sp. SWN248]
MWIVSLIGFIVTLGFGVIGPSLPALGREFNAGTTLMSLAISGFAAARLITNLAFAKYLDRLRLRTVLWVGLLVQSVCSIIAGLSPDYLGFITFRTISGVGSAAFTIASSALLLVLAPVAVRGRAMSVFASSTALGTVAGPALGGLLAIFDPRLPLLGYGGALALASAVTVVLLRSARDVKAVPAEVAPEGGVIGGRRAAFAAIFSDRLFVAAVACQVLVGWVFYGMRTTTLPLNLSSIGYSVGVIGLLLSISAVLQIVGSSTGGTISDRIGRIKPLVVGLGLAFLAAVGLNFSEYFTIAVITFMTLGLAGGLIATAAISLLGDSKVGRSGFGLAAYWVGSDLAGILGPLVSGLLAESLGFGAAYVVAAMLVVTTLIFVLRAGRSLGPTFPGANQTGPTAPYNRPELG